MPFGLNCVSAIGLNLASLGVVGGRVLVGLCVTGSLLLLCGCSCVSLVLLVDKFENFT